MAPQMSVLLFPLMCGLIFVSDVTNAQGLQMGFYKKTCPAAENIVRQVTAQAISVAPSLAAPLLRMHFHDCFVRGCDASVLLDTPGSEKTAIPNLSLRGFQIIDNAKSAVEKACPGVVSCADIIALVARDATALIHGAYWDVPTGRRDGRVSNATEVFIELPAPFHNITVLEAMFAAKGLNLKDLVLLSGAHTIGISQCSSFSNRLYNFTGIGDSDPSMDPNYVERLKMKCKPGDSTTLAEMDPGSRKTFDTDYFVVVAKRRGLFESDAALLNNEETKSLVKLLATGSQSIFFSEFGKSMVKMGMVDVLTGTAGEVRNKCSMVN